MKPLDVLDTMNVRTRIRAYEVAELIVQGADLHDGPVTRYEISSALLVAIREFEAESYGTIGLRAIYNRFVEKGLDYE
jgi:hypothetical protein